MCVDRRCTDGVTWCEPCHGYGVMTMGGKRYRVKGNGKNIGATAIPHVLCSGTGLAVCGCTPGVQLKVLEGAAS
jgi:hypothetical protein